MKTGVSASLLVLGIGLILFSYVWARFVPAPFNDESLQDSAEAMIASSNREFSATSAPAKSQAELDELMKKAEEGKKQVSAYNARISVGKFVLRLCGIIASIVGGGMYLWTRAQEE
jgi:hypothetical protein